MRAHDRSPSALFGALAELKDAGDAIALLRSGGGLDDWFEQGDAMDGLDEFECEVLEQAQAEARGRTLEAYLARLDEQARKLAAVRDETHGIELATIHGAKGRQWPHVFVVGCDDGTLTHARAREASAEQQARGEGLEAERRLAYVAWRTSPSRAPAGSLSCTTTRRTQARFSPKPACSTSARRARAPLAARHRRRSRPQGAAASRCTAMRCPSHAGTPTTRRQQTPGHPHPYASRPRQQAAPLLTNAMRSVKRRRR